MQHKVKNKNIKSCIYEKNILYRFQYFTNMFLLLYPQEALAASKEGMQLWLNVLLPVAAISDIDRNIDSYKYGRKTTAACGSDLE